MRGSHNSPECVNDYTRLLERFSERVEPMRRLVALFGLYTFYFTQPRDTQISLYSTTHVDIALGECRLVFVWAL